MYPFFQLSLYFYYQEPESSPDKKSWDKNNSSNNKFSNGAESPKSVRKRFGSASEDTLLKVNGVNDGSVLTAQEMEAFKAEIIKEVRKEFQKMKQEIVDGKDDCGRDNSNRSDGVVKISSRFSILRYMRSCQNGTE